ncbi:putative electron transfer flavoprotein-ubiquinone oxidoreductase, mitochondrial [Colletotrichum spaethianum]|uniref:Probable electron transfer flavoprotein subunit alpha n=1 Tax=Colletotrichum spaethianum TaxID=700344 RepID=A0AA37PDJ9_9PEZI|nr:putative electron transfer flavoprotein-ubiquinone oxidoreductase, mitochondrial [Colletotrichum spaethianum]GKT50229.1 putative electron transfer flavoprotein-ubiquinone oxidoreductase, mitochondrial [Colletotrichum spaethianum]
MLFFARRAAASGAAAASRGLSGFRPGSTRSLLSTLAILEQREGQLNHGSLSAITAAKKLGGSVHGFVAGSNIKGVADEAAKVEGVEKIIAVENAAYDKGLPENYAPLLVENIKKGGYTHIIAGHTAFGKNLMPRVAALLDSQQISDITSIENENTFVRPIYAGNAIATVESSDAIKIVTIRGTAFPAAEIASGSAAVEDGVDPKSESTTEWVSEDLAKSDRPDLSTASKVVSGGRGLKSKEEFDKVMLPWPILWVLPLTGKVVAPQLYLAVGISGAIQHLAGMKDSKVIAAINKDGDAPIFQVADVGLVGDLFDKVPELTEKIKQQ